MLAGDMRTINDDRRVTRHFMTAREELLIFDRAAASRR